MGRGLDSSRPLAAPLHEESLARITRESLPCRDHIYAVMTPQTHQLLNQELLAGEEDLLVPRLVARIAELEHALYSSELKLQSGEGHHGSNIIDRFSSLIKRAQQGLDASVAYL